MGLLKQKIFLQFSGVPSGQAVLGLLNPKIDMNLEDIVAVNICNISLASPFLMLILITLILLFRLGFAARFPFST